MNWSLSPIVYDGTRTPLKAVLFVLVCLAWLVPGLVGHDPWKTDDAVVFGLVFEIVRSGDPVFFQLAGEPYFEKAPLYLWVSALSGRLFGSLLPLHDAARLASGFFMAVTLGFLSLASRELLGDRAVRVAVLLFIGCLGLLIRAHEMSSDIAGLAGFALALYGLALAVRRPRLGGVATGIGVGVAFLGDGFLPLAMLGVTMATLPLVHRGWRTRGYAMTVAIAFACAVPLIALWPAMLWLKSPFLLNAWLEASAPTRWSSSSPATLGNELAYFLRVIPWYAWPAWPFAAWAVWRSRRMLAERKGVVLPLVAFVAFLAVLVLFGETREVNAMPLLLPLAILGVAELDSVPRGAASALDWFGMMTFFLFATMIWLAWTAAITGQPYAVLTWLRNEVPGFRYSFSFVGFALAALLTLIWLVVIARSLRSTRRALVNWAAGITMVWMLVMTLGVPLVDQARSYREVSTKLVEALPAGFRCITQKNLGEAQRAVLDYFIGLRAVRLESPEAARCQVLLLQVQPQKVSNLESVGWREIWRGSRPGDRNEAFVLYERIKR
jgi:4-amino-4-deoxy-L-arabinose transferase-like glycosyltransferase